MAEAVKANKLVKDVPPLKIIEGREYLSQKLTDTLDISRPGLELTGCFNFYPKNRIRLLGRIEIPYGARSDHDLREQVSNKMAIPETPYSIVSRGSSAPSGMLETAEKGNIPVFSSNIATTHLSSVITQLLDEKLAPRKSIHGVLVEIYGMSILIAGSSGIGKPETALDLAKRGHRLVTDDRVDVYQRDDKTVVREVPKILEHLMEIRGVGIIDVMNLFGADTIKDSTEIQLIVCLRNQDPKTNYDRLGFNEKTREISEVDVPQVTVPVKVERNLATTVGVVATNFRAKKTGYDISQKFEQDLTELISDNSKKDEGGSKE